MTTKIMIF